MSKKRILVRAPFLTQSGYGEHGRFVLRSLRQYEDFFDIYAIPISWGQTSWLWEDNKERDWFDSIIKKTIADQSEKGQNLSYDVSVQVTIPNEWEKLAPINIGVTAGIEATEVSPSWIEKSLLMDKIIVPSQFAADIFKNTRVNVINKNTNESQNNFKTTTPFEVIHYPIKNHDVEDIQIDLDYDFNFMTVAQWGPRKNVDNLIRWFVEEFIDQEVGLVLKLSFHKNCYMDRKLAHVSVANILKNYPQKKCKVYILHGHMTDNQMASIYKHPKIKSFITATHGEGFGLPLFDAAINGLPVVAPEWSGHLDFLTMPIANKKTKKAKTKPAFAKVDFHMEPIPEAAVWPGVLEKHVQWCVPEQGSFKMRLREVYKDYTRFKSQSKKLQKWIFKNFKEEDKMREIAESIYGSKLKTVSLDEIPKISIITSVYDGDEHIKPFLEDITQQTIFKDKCELILLNANSPGNEEEIILEYKEKFPENIVYRKLEEDPGIYGVWNIGLEMATGEFITNANLDDRKAPWSLEKHAKELHTNTDVDLVYSDMYITHNSNETWTVNSCDGNRYNFPEFSFENLKMMNMPHAAPMWRRDIHTKHGFFNTKYKSAGDWDMWLRAASKGSKFKKINEILGLYYFNPKGISTNPDNFDWKQKEEAEIYENYKLLEVTDEGN